MNIPKYYHLTAEMTDKLLRFYKVCDTKTKNRIVASKLKQIKKTKGTMNILELADILRNL